MFQDEARFGRISDTRRCWAPAGVRPEVSTQVVREYEYAFAAVSPHDGALDTLVLPSVNAEAMLDEVIASFVAVLKPASLDYINDESDDWGMMRSVDLVDAIAERFGTRVHPRSVERALTRSDRPKSGGGGQ